MQEGLQQTTPRQSSKTSDIDELLNHLLDARRPAALTQQGVSRVSNIYAYLSFGEDIYDITSGNAITIGQLCRRSQRAIVRLEVDDADCYVSDLDLFDQIKIGYAENADVEGLIDAYWSSIINVSKCKPGIINRPEAMIVSSVMPSHMTIVQR